MNDTPTPFEGFRALSFDCYGTLIDWETGIGRALQSWAARRSVSASLHELLALFGTIETHVQQDTRPVPSYPQVLEETLRRIGRSVGAEVDERDASTFADSIRVWPAFADSTAALRRLQSRYRLIIVSNVDRASFEHSRRLLAVDFDRVITAEEVGAYKPKLPHFEALLHQLEVWGMDRAALLHVAQSLFHDHEPAGRLGLASAWIDRRHNSPGYGATPPPAGAAEQWDWRFESLADFAGAALDT